MHSFSPMRLDRCTSVRSHPLRRGLGGAAWLPPAAAARRALTAPLAAPNGSRPTAGAAAAAASLFNTTSSSSSSSSSKLLVPHQQLRHRRRRLLCCPVSVLERARADLGNAREEADERQQQQRLRQQQQDELSGQRQQQFNNSSTTTSSSSTGPLPGTLLSSAEHEGGITTAVSRSDGGSGGGSTYYHVRVTGPPGARLVLHWGVDDWRLPPAGCIPPGSEQAGDRAVRTPFTSDAATSADATAAAADDVDGSDYGDGEAAAAEEADVAAAAAPASVSLAFPAAECPERLVFVVHDVASDAWLRDHSADFSLPLRAPCLTELVEAVLRDESSAEHWGLLHRLTRVCELLDSAEAAGPSGVAFVFAWLRLSNARRLDWARAFSYQPRDIAWAQRQVSELVAARARGARDPAARALLRMMLGGLSRGGQHDGDAIRHGILDIMRNHGIAEGNRPGFDEPFLEQWHQKLHQNTTPEDVAIADAYIAFLKSNSHDDWWAALAAAGVTPERMAAWAQPITALPIHLPHLLPDVERYRWTLLKCHAGAELDVALDAAAWALDDDLRWHAYDLAAHRHAWWAPGKCLELRRRLAPLLSSGHGGRDVQLLDIALEAWLRLCVERTDRKSLSADDLVELLGVVLDSAALTGADPEAAQAAAQWARVRAAPERWAHEWCLAAAAALGRVQLTLGRLADELHNAVQPYAEMFGARCGIPPAYTRSFGEEAVRDQPVFVASLLAAELEPRLRTAAGGSVWQIVSQPGLSAAGHALALPTLADVQGASFARPTVVLASALGGMEDIPPGVVALLTRGATDVLSHVAIRARCQGVLLATCLDDAVWADVMALAGREVALTVRPSGDVVAADAAAAAAAASADGDDAAAASAAAAAAAQGSSDAAEDAAAAAAAAAATDAVAGGGSRQTRHGAGADAPVGWANGNGHGFLHGNPLELLRMPGLAALPGLAPALARGGVVAGAGAGALLPRLPGRGGLAAVEWALQEEEFAPGRVGAKARNLAALRRRLPDWVTVPRSVALPYGCLEACLSAPANAATAARLRSVLQQLERWRAGGLPGVLLREARELVATGLVAPPGMRPAVRSALVAAGLVPASGPGAWVRGDGAGCPGWDALFRAVCRVWASKWNDRAWLSRRARGYAEADLKVSVLVQRVLPAQYAWVLHTACPLTARRGAIFGEVVLGLGESLVANHPGRPLSFQDRPDGSATELLVLPSKRTGLFLPGTGQYLPPPAAGDGGDEGAVSAAAAAAVPPALIARSDTSGEDLDGYAGAGLYDSAPVVPLDERSLDYAGDPLVWDRGFRGALLDGLVELGCAVEAAFGGAPQDVEGVWMDGRFAVVQSRPQVLAPTRAANEPSASAAATPAKVGATVAQR